MAWCLAVAISQAPGLGGMPDSGHCLSAATRASCASSSARPTSFTSRARPAMILADLPLAAAGDLPEAPRQLDRLFLRPRLDQRKAEDGLLGLGERAVGHGD